MRIHQQIYRQRADVGSVTRTMSLLTLGLTPNACHGSGAYFYPAAPWWSDPLLD